MKRSGPPQRKTPLKASKPLKRVTALNASPFARSTLHAQSAERRQQPKRPAARSAVPALVRAALTVRSGGFCEIAQPGCAVFATDFSHRLKSGMGGRKGAVAAAHHVLSNALAACRPCHSDRLHGQPKQAYARGWMLREGDNPLTTRVLYRGRWVLLTDDGLTVPATTTAEEAS